MSSLTQTNAVNKQFTLQNKAIINLNTAINKKTFENVHLCVSLIFVNSNVRLSE